MSTARQTRGRREAYSVQIPAARSPPSRGISGDWRLRCVAYLPGPLAGQLSAKCTTWFSDSIGDRGRRAELVATWLGTRSERANLAAIRRGRKPLQAWCCTRPHIRPRPRLVRQERKLQRLQSKQSGSSVRLLVVLVHGGKIGVADIVPLLRSKLPPAYGPITSYSNAMPSGSFSANQAAAASAVAKTLRCSGSSTCLLVLM